MPRTIPADLSNYRNELDTHLKEYLSHTAQQPTRDPEEAKIAENLIVALQQADTNLTVNFLEIEDYLKVLPKAPADEADAKNYLSFYLKNFFEQYEPLFQGSHYTISEKADNNPALLITQSTEILARHEQLVVEEKRFNLALQAQLASSKVIIETLATRHIRLQQQLATADSLNATLRQELQDKEKAVEQLKEAGTQLSLELAEKNKEISRLTQLTEDQAAAIQNLNQDKVALQAELTLMRQAQEKLLQENTALQASISKMSTTIMAAKATGEKAVESYGQDVVQGPVAALIGKQGGPLAMQQQVVTTTTTEVAEKTTVLPTPVVRRM